MLKILNEKEKDSQQLIFPQSNNIDDDGLQLSNSQ